MKWIRGWMALGLLMGLVVVGCGGDEEEQTLQCGEQTVLENGQCVPDTDACPPTQILTEHGTCIEPWVYCDDEADTTYDRFAEECVWDGDIECGEGTVAVDGECVLEDPLSCSDDTVLVDGECIPADTACGEGSAFDADQLECHPTSEACGVGAEYDIATGECVDLNFVECGDGTRVSGSRCVSDATFADELAEDADIDYADNQPIVPDEDEPFVFTGTLDEQLTQTFQIEGGAGQWLKIEIFSRGLPSPGLRIRHPVGSWHRHAPAGQTAHPISRTVMLPADETFEVVVDTAAGDEAGDDSWKYVGRVEVLDAPDPVQWDDPEDGYSGELAETTHNFVEVDVDGTYDLLLTPELLGDGAVDPRVEVWTEPDEHRETAEMELGEQLQIDAGGAETLFLHFDAVGFAGADTDFELAAGVTEIIAPGDSMDVDIEADTGEVVFISHRSAQTERLDISVQFDGTEKYLFTGAPAANQSSFSEHESMRQFFYVDEPGTYTVEFLNNTGDEITSFVSDVYADDDIPYLEIPDEGWEEIQQSVESDGLSTGDWRIAVVDMPDQGIFDAAVEAQTGDPRLAVIDDEHRQQHGITTANNGRAELRVGAPGEGIYYVVARADDSSTISDLEFEIGGQTLESMEPGEVRRMTFDAQTLDVLEGTIVSTTSEAIDVRLFNEFDDQLFEYTDVEHLRMVELFPGTGEFTLEIENTTSSSAPIGVDVTHGEPFDSLGVSEDTEESWQRGPMDEGDRDYLVVHAQLMTVTAALEAKLDDEESMRIRAFSVGENAVAADETAAGSVSAAVSMMPSTTMVFELRATTDIAQPFDVDFEATAVQELTIESSPNIDIGPDDPDDPNAPYDAADTIDFPSCIAIDEIEVYVQIDHWYRGDLIVDIIAPGGQTARIHNQTGSWNNDIIGTYPYPSDPDLEDGEELLDLIGESGTGTWTIEIVDTYEPSDSLIGTLENWSITLSC